MIDESRLQAEQFSAARPGGASTGGGWSRSGLMDQSVLDPYPELPWTCTAHWQEKAVMANSEISPRNSQLHVWQNHFVSTGRRRGSPRLHRANLKRLRRSAALSPRAPPLWPVRTAHEGSAISICRHPSPSGPTLSPGRRQRGTIRRVIVDAGQKQAAATWNSGRECFTRGRNVRLQNRAKVKWVLSVER